MSEVVAAALVDIRKFVFKEFAKHDISLPENFDIFHLEKYCRKRCEICWGEDGIQQKGVILWQFGFCKGPYPAKEGE